eukprot:TRINITY_DN3060_c0_g1_i3.p1 TRINITY_DN3060_c0_g1~~TRINITY_DN3060_c0_g1_i3.p1  ORF type:complete len:339 (-),score=87.59 TRINITY_DN3060_c0_g1_i3:319-1335(-)
MEFADSEKNYIDSLRVLTESFFPVLAEYEELIDQDSIMGGGFGKMSKAIVRIYEVHSGLMEDLHAKAYLKTGQEASMAPIVTQICDAIRTVYGHYLVHLHKVVTRIGVLQQTNKQFDKAMKMAIRSNRRKGKGLGVHSFMFQPVQRMAGYRLLCDRLAKVTTDDHILHPERLEFKNQMRQATEYTDALCQKFTKVEKLMACFSPETHSEVFGLLEFGEQIWKEGQLSRVEEGAASRTCMCWLLKESFLWIELGLFEEVGQHHKAEMICLDGVQCLQSATSNSFSLEGLEFLEMPQYRFQAKDEAECLEWVQAIGCEHEQHALSPKGAAVNAYVASILV